MLRSAPLPSRLAPRHIPVRPRSTASIDSTLDDSSLAVVKRLRRLARRMLPRTV